MYDRLGTSLCLVDRIPGEALPKVTGRSTLIERVLAAQAKLQIKKRMTNAEFKKYLLKRKTFVLPKGATEEEIKVWSKPKKQVIAAYIRNRMQSYCNQFGVTVTTVRKESSALGQKEAARLLLVQYNTFKKNALEKDFYCDILFTNDEPTNKACFNEVDGQILCKDENRRPCRWVKHQRAQPMQSIVDVVHLVGMQIDHLIPQENIKAAFRQVYARDKMVDWDKIEVLLVGFANLAVVDIRCHDTGARVTDCVKLEAFITHEIDKNSAMSDFVMEKLIF